ncbi:MAG TPA: CpaD family pilus assembly lipoprotein [Stellaceae bacterium]|nr:CpaD family pilus assembly lipoprotein [Stellaceae bacterium]
MNRYAPILLAIAAAALQACATPSEEWSSVEANRDIRVDFARTTFAATYARGASALSPAEQARLNDFLSAAQVQPRDSVYLEPAAGDRLATGRINTLARELEHRGLEVSALPAARDAVPANSLLVVVDRYVATPPNCPNFTKSSSEDHENAPPSNWGCSNQANLGLMVANPRDLVIGRDPSPEPADAAVLPIQRYRAGKTAPLPSESAGGTYGATSTSSGGSSGTPTQGTGQ